MDLLTVSNSISLLHACCVSFSVFYGDAIVPWCIRLSLAYFVTDFIILTKLPWRLDYVVHHVFVLGGLVLLLRDGSPLYIQMYQVGMLSEISTIFMDLYYLTKGILFRYFFAVSFVFLRVLYVPYALASLLSQVPCPICYLFNCIGVGILVLQFYWSFGICLKLKNGLKKKNE